MNRFGIGRTFTHFVNNWFHCVSPLRLYSYIYTILTSECQPHKEKQNDKRIDYLPGVFSALYPRT